MKYYNRLETAKVLGCNPSRIDYITRNINIESAIQSGKKGAVRLFDENQIKLFLFIDALKKENYSFKEIQRIIELVNEGHSKLWTIQSFNENGEESEPLICTEEYLKNEIGNLKSSDRELLLKRIILPKIKYVTQSQITA